jgi:hypothetical protein
MCGKVKMEEVVKQTKVIPRMPERLGRVRSIPASYFAGSGFKSRLRDRLS